MDIRQVGRELGVHYVLEGSIRKAGNRVRISGQLIEAASGRHIWADRFDRELADIFVLQDETKSHCSRSGRLLVECIPGERTTIRQAETRRA